LVAAQTDRPLDRRRVIAFRRTDRPVASGVAEINPSAEVPVRRLQTPADLPIS